MFSTTRIHPSKNSFSLVLNVRPGIVDQPASKSDSPTPVEAEELNSWKRGFTPQAEIWNGRLAMIGLSAGIAVILLVRVFTGG